MVNKRKIGPFMFASIVVCLLMTSYCIIFAGSQGFGFDELFNIGVVSHQNSFADMMKVYITTEVTNPPLYTAFLYCWYRLAPYGEMWLLLPNILFWLIGTIALMKTVYKATSDESAVFIAVCFSAVNVFMINSVAWELRNYAMMYMFAALVLYFYMRTRYEQSLRNLIILGIFMVLLAFTHYFGDLTIALLAASDVFLFVRKKIKLKFVIPYLMCFVTMGPFFAVMLINKRPSLGDFWIGKPGIMTILNTFVTLLGNKWGFFAAGIILLIAITGLIKNRPDTVISNFFVTDVFVMSAEFLIIFLYSFFINPKGSVWLVRYFVVLMPFIYFAVSYGISALKVDGKIRILICLLIPISLFTGSAQNFIKLTDADSSIISDNVNYRDAANAIKSSNGKRKLVISAMAGGFEKGWEEYYFDHSDVDCVGNDAIPDNFAEKYDKIFVFIPRGEVKESYLKYIDNNYSKKIYYDRLKLSEYSN